MKQLPTDHKVINIDEIDSEQQDSQSGVNKRSFVWTHFKEQPGTMEAICGGTIKKDKSSSTTPFHTHLSALHQISNPCLTKKTKVNHINIKKWSFSAPGKPISIFKNLCQLLFIACYSSFSCETLSSALCYLIPNADLPLLLLKEINCFAISSASSKKMQQH
jgi:hypothetical protein